MRRTFRIRPSAHATALGIAILGLALAMPALAAPRFTPSSHAFGPVAVGQSASVHVFVDETPGGDRVRSLGVGPDTSYWYNSDWGDFHLDRGTCVQGVTNISPGVGCTITITYTPTASGAVSTNAIASNNNAGAWAFMALTATGVAPQPVPAPGLAGILALTPLMAAGAAVLARRRVRRRGDNAVDEFSPR